MDKKTPTPPTNLKMKSYLFFCVFPFRFVAGAFASSATSSPSPQKIAAPRKPETADFFEEAEIIRGQDHVVPQHFEARKVIEKTQTRVMNAKEKIFSYC